MQLLNFLKKWSIIYGVVLCLVLQTLSSCVNSSSDIQHHSKTFNVSHITKIFCLCDSSTPFDLKNIFNVLHLAEFDFKVNFSFSVILRNGGEHDPEFKYFHSRQNNAVVLDVAFRCRCC